jgi:HSP20 family protein
MNNRSLKIRDPFREIRDLERKIWQDFFTPNYWPTTLASQISLPSSELTEDENNYYLTVELPGVDKENIKIEADEKNLKISGERKEERQKENARQHYSELIYGSFGREYRFREAIEEGKIKANYQNGILNLTIPKSGESKLQKIEIK